MTAALLEHVATYAARVRAHLADLSPEQVDDLTDGLEADLAEALHDSEGKAITGEVPVVGADAGATRPVVSRGASSTTALMDLTARFGSPKDYAEELRSAAGLPTPVVAGGKQNHSLAQVLRGRAQAIQERLDSSPSWPAVSSFLQTMRPLWWVLRGWMLYSFVAYFAAGGYLQAIPSTFFQWLLFVVLLAASLFYGQRRWVAKGRMRTVMIIVEIICIWMVVPTLASADAMFHGRYAGASDVSYVYSDAPVADGVYVDGQPVSNLFVYDANGDFIEHAQIVDGQGRPVRIDGNGDVNETPTLRTALTPLSDTYGRPVWNAFPLFATPLPDSAEWNGESWSLPEGTVPKVPAPPLERLAPLDLKSTSAPAGATPDTRTDPTGDGSDPTPRTDPTGDGSDPADTPEGSPQGDEAEQDPVAAPDATSADAAEVAGGVTG